MTNHVADAGRESDHGDSFGEAPERSAARIALAFAALGVVWITVSDQVLALFLRDPEHFLAVQTYKGVAFVLLTAGFLFWLVRRDLRRRIRGDETARGALNRLRSLVDAAPLAVFTCTRDGHVQFWNARAQELFGWNDGAGLSELLLADRDAREPPLTLREAARIGARLPESVLAYPHRSGALLQLAVTTAPLAGARGEQVGIVGLAEDITERKRVEEQLFRAQRMEAVGRLTGGIAHDFNNLLTAISGLAEAALMDLPGENPVREDVEQIQAAASHAAGLTEQLLAYSRQQVLRPSVVELNQVVEEVESMLIRLIGEHIKLVADLEPRLPPVYVDIHQLKQVIVNLVVNSRDAMPEGGTILVRTRERRLTQEVASGYAYAVDPGDYVVLEVEDSGVGIPEHVLPQIFEPFFTTKASGEGTGLGLSTVYGIVKQSEGYVWISSREGKGTTVEVLLPVHTSPEVAEPEHEAPDELRGTETVLVVDDDERVRRLVARLLDDMGYTVLTAGDGGEALRVALASTAPIHILVTDLVMPGMSGRQLSDELRRSRPHIPVLFMSGFSAELVGHHDLQASGALYLRKPFTARQLRTAVRSLLDG